MNASCPFGAIEDNQAFAKLVVATECNGVTRLVQSLSIQGFSPPEFVGF